MLPAAPHESAGEAPPAVRGVPRLDRLALLAASIAWLAATAWLRPLRLPDEGRYVGVAWEMLRSGDWLTPMLDGLPFLHKPPLVYWITAGALSLFGANAWAARAAPLLGALLGALALHAFVRRWGGGARAAHAGLLALLVQPLFFLGAQFANMDMLVAGCITATILALADALLRLERGRPYRRSLFAAYALAALGVLAKGLIGVVIPALVVGTWLLCERRWRLARSLAHPGGVALLLAIAAPWFLAMQRLHPGFIDYFFVLQHFKRYAGSGFNNVEPGWFYAGVLALGGLPTLPWLLAAGRRSHATPLRSLAWAWLAVVVVFFSIPRSKPLGYILPAVPAFALLASDGFLAAPARRRLWRASLALSASVCLVALDVLAQDRAHTTRALALALAEYRRAGEPVVMLDRYDYDLPFYARLREPVRVAGDWSAAPPRTDGWRKEFADAARFAHGASTPLLDRAALPAALCAAPVSWLVGSLDAAAIAYPFLAHAQRLALVRGVALWRVEPARPALSAALGCGDAL
jgi:4-amino-4-deoxy-L-arabinose transferase-like glycosyltransferase